MLPERFLRHLADAECSVVSWSAGTAQLVLNVEKEIGPEAGTLVFNGVSFVNLPPRFTVAAAASSQQEVPDFPGVVPEDSEWLYVFQEAWGRAFYVIAENAEYAESGPTKG